MKHKMKESGIEVIGEIPKHWKIKKIKNICNTITDYVANGSFASLKKNVEYLDEPDYAMLIRTTDLSGSARSEKKVYINKHAYDFLSKSKLFGGELILPNIGAVGDVYLVNKQYENMSLAPNSIMIKTDYNDKFYYYWFLSLGGKESLKELCNSTAQQKFNKTQLKEVRVLLPSIEEQNKIVDYLDFKCSKVDNLIEETKIMIDKLIDYRDSLISEAVTNGLNPNVKMKNSAVQWVDQIPYNWLEIKLKYLGNISSNGVDKKIRKGQPLYKAVHYVDVYKNKLGELKNNDYLTVSCDPKKAEICQLYKGDVIFTNSSETPDDIGNSTLVVEEMDKTLLGYHLTRFRPKKNLYFKFLKFMFNSSYVLNYFSIKANGITRYGLKKDDVSNLLLVVPPYEEQIQIATFLEKKCNSIEQLIKEKELFIAKLERYKNSVIYECVTGKKVIN